MIYVTKQHGGQNVHNLNAHSVRYCTYSCYTSILILHMHSVLTVPSVVVVDGVVVGILVVDGVVVVTVYTIQPLYQT